MSDEKSKVNQSGETTDVSPKAKKEKAPKVKKEKTPKAPKTKLTKEQKQKKSAEKAKQKKDAKQAAAASGKSSAELAREKRKANVEKTAEKQALKAKKKAEQTPKQKRLKVIIPSVVAALVIAIFFICYFGVPERHITAVKVSDGSKVSVAEYEYYYRSLYNYYANMSQQYESNYSSYYGTGAGKSMTGFDYTKTPENQEYTSTSTSSSDTTTLDKSYGDNPTWADYFEETSIETSQKYTIVYNKAVKAGYKMSKSETSDMNDFIEELRSSAADDDYSLDAYLRENYGRGMTESLLKEIYIKQTVASDYLDDVQTNYSDGITDDEINAEFKKNSSDYETVSLRYFDFTSEVSSDDGLSKTEIKEANAKLLKKAKAFLAEATSDNFSDVAYEYADDDYKSYYEDDDTYTTMDDTTYDTLTSSISEDASKWAYSDSTKVGDSKIITIDGDDGIESYYIVLLTKAPTKDETYPVTIRQILFQASDDADSSSSSSSSDSTTTHTWSEAKSLAEKELKTWKAGKATDASFATLANNDSEDTGSNTTGGLYEDVTPSSGYVEEFTDWCFADGRKAGDTGIIKTSYGYHVMYCKSVDTEPVWKSTIRTNLTTTKYNSFNTKLTEKDSLSEASSHWEKKIRSRVEKYAETVIANLSSSSSSSSSSAS